MQELAIVAGAHLLAVASPGPDFAVVLKTALTQQRRTALLASLGVALGILVHVTYSMIGIALVISQSIVLFNIIKLMGAAYLIWIGIMALRSSRIEGDLAEFADSAANLSDGQAVKLGFLTNVLNPKATLFFLSLFTQVISPQTSGIVKLAYGLEMTIVTFLWFGLISVFMTQKPVQAAYLRVRHHADRLFGVLLIGLGIKVALGSRG